MYFLNDSENENKTFKLQLTFIQEKMKQIEMDQNFCLKNYGYHLPKLYILTLVHRNLFFLNKLSEQTTTISREILENEYDSLNLLFCSTSELKTKR